MWKKETEMKKEATTTTTTTKISSKRHQKNFDPFSELLRLNVEEEKP